MSVTTTAEPETRIPGEVAGPRRWQRVIRSLPLLTAIAVVGVAAALPLLRNTIFYYWDDTAVAGVPVWRRMAEVVLSGNFPQLELDMWRGGNFAAEAAIGMWNPIALGLALLTYPIDNMALAITIVKVSFMVIGTVGSYLLAREYAVRPWLAATMAAAVPLTGYAFFMDATAWINPLMINAFIPWLWLTARRNIRGQGSLLWVVVAGYLACSLGPYALLATGVVLLGVMVEAWYTGQRRRILPVLLAGVAIALLNVIIYLPLLVTAPVGYRAAASFVNNEFLSPSLTHMLGISTPAYEPWMVNFAGDSKWRIPVMYVAWFLLPLVPWMRWRVLRERWRSLLTPFIVGGVFLLLAMGPSDAWMFRWPLRLVDFLWPAVILLWVIVANQGIERSRFRLRATLSALIILLGGYVAWSDEPTHRVRIAAGLVGLGVLVAALVWRGFTTRSAAAVMIGGLVGVLGYHLYFYPENFNTAPYRLPTSEKLLEERFAKYDDVTVQVAELIPLYPELYPDGAYRDVLFGSMYAVAGVDSLNAYSGLGFTKMDSTLCMSFTGSTSACRTRVTWDRLWQNPDGYQVPLVDLLRARTVVIQNSVTETRDKPAPPGWRRAPDAEATGLFTVWKRIEPLAWPDGRLSNVSDGVQVTADRMDGRIDERLDFRRADVSGPATLTFARLNWPGYTATVNGQPAEVRTTSTGLVAVDLPAGVQEGELRLSWQPPGRSVSIASFAIGALLTAGLTAWPAIARRRSGTRRDAGPTEPEPLDSGR